MENIHQGIEPILTVRDLAKLLKTSEKAIYAMYQRGHIEGAFRLGRRLLFKRDIILNWIENKIEN